MEYVHLTPEEKEALRKAHQRSIEVIQSGITAWSNLYYINPDKTAYDYMVERKQEAYPKRG